MTPAHEPPDPTTDGAPATTWLTELVHSATAGDRAAWNELVERTHRIVWKAVNMMTTDDEIRADAFAATWLRLAERIGTIREPEKLPGWLTTTATNEARRLLRRRHRDDVHLESSVPDDLFASLLADPGAEEHDASLVQAESNRAVRRAFASLDEECREILTVLVLAEPVMPYHDASVRLGRPIGSLGPARRRCLDKLRTNLATSERGAR